MGKRELLFNYIYYIYDLKRLLVEKKKIPAELIVEIKRLQYIIKNYDSIQRKLGEKLGKKQHLEKPYLKAEYFNQFSKDYFEIVNKTEEIELNKVK